MTWQIKQITLRILTMALYPAGRLTHRALGNGLSQNFTYNPWTTQGGRLQNITTGTLQNLSYTYDDAGNVQTITDTIAKEKNEYGYDTLDRLTDWKLTKTDTLAVLFDEDYLYDPTSGNLKTKAGVTFEYPTGGTRPHAATSADNGTPSALNDDNSYTYDANGNQTTRIVNGETFNLSYDAENRLVEVKKNTAIIATFTYDGDGRRVKAVENPSTGSHRPDVLAGGQAVTTTFVGAHYELTNGTVTKHYFAGTSRIATSKYTTPGLMKVEYLLTDHLGSTSLTTDKAGTKVSEMRYKPFGEVRSWWTSSTVTAPSCALTKYTFTGQYSHIILVGDMDDPSTSGVTEGFGLLFYQSRFYDPALGRFTSADTIVPGGVQGYDRYAYVNNSPLNYVDPSGHEPKYGCYASTNGTCINANGTSLSPGNGASNPTKKTASENNDYPLAYITESIAGTETQYSLYYSCGPFGAYDSELCSTEYYYSLNPYQGNGFRDAMESFQQPDPTYNFAESLLGLSEGGALGTTLLKLLSVNDGFHDLYEAVSGVQNVSELGNEARTPSLSVGVIQNPVVEYANGSRRGTISGVAIIYATNSAPSLVPLTPLNTVTLIKILNNLVK